MKLQETTLFLGISSNNSRASATSPDLVYKSSKATPTKISVSQQVFKAKPCTPFPTSKTSSPIQAFRTLERVNLLGLNPTILMCEKSCKESSKQSFSA
uniref:Uncharacterized protein n=1 Tax=Rhizophora mucronata TaxID=61149 RepID=A0A2P2JDS4_RHIMU